MLTNKETMGKVIRCIHMLFFYISKSVHRTCSGAIWEAGYTHTVCQHKADWCIPNSVFELVILICNHASIMTLWLMEISIVVIHNPFWRFKGFLWYICILNKTIVSDKVVMKFYCQWKNDDSINVVPSVGNTLYLHEADIDKLEAIQQLNCKPYVFCSKDHEMYWMLLPVMGYRSTGDTSKICKTHCKPAQSRI